MLGKKNEIKAGNNSTNNQADIINNNYGFSYQDFKDLAKDLFRENFLVMKNEAAAVAVQRAEELVDKFLSRLEREPSETLVEFASPGMQDSLFNAQKQYALNGEGELCDMLVEMLIERAKTPEKSKKRIILDESLTIAPKLTVSQMDLITWMVFTYLTTLNNIQSLHNFLDMINKYSKLLDAIDESILYEDLSFLEYLKIGRFGRGVHPKFTQTYRTYYPSYFMKGFAIEDIEVLDKSVENLIRLESHLMPCFHDLNKYQFKYETVEELRYRLSEHGFSKEEIDIISSNFDGYAMTDDEIKAFMIHEIPSFEKFERMEGESLISGYEITIVGIAIGVSNMQRLFGEKYDLSIWIKS